MVGEANAKGDTRAAAAPLCHHASPGNRAQMARLHCDVNYASQGDRQCLAVVLQLIGAHGQPG